MPRWKQWILRHIIKDCEAIVLERLPAGKDARIIFGRVGFNNTIQQRDRAMEYWMSNS